MLTLQIIMYCVYQETGPAGRLLDTMMSLRGHHRLTGVHILTMAAVQDVTSQLREPGSFPGMTEMFSDYWEGL